MKEVKKVEDKKIACPLCGMGFNSQDEMDKHSQQAHPSNRSSVSCPYCGMALKNQEEYEKHRLETHKDQK